MSDESPGLRFRPIRWMIDGPDAEDSVFVEWSGKSGYAVRYGGYCLGKSGKWSHEPFPSERGDEWLAEYRYATIREAGKAAAIAVDRWRESQAETA